MSNRKLVFAAVALIGCVVASVAWYLLGEAAAQQAQREERRPPMSAPSVSERPTSAHGAPRFDGAVARRAGGQFSGGKVGARSSVPVDCPCRESRRG
jgi:hypothetical protein